MTEQSVESEIGVSREGLVLKGSRVIPLLLAGVAVVLLLAKGIDWLDFPLSDYPRLSAAGSDLADLDLLVGRLAADDEGDPVSRFLWQAFSHESRERLVSELTPHALQQESLIEELNTIIDGGYSIYSDRLFCKDLHEFALQLVAGGELPETGQSTVLVAREGEELKFRVFYRDGRVVDYGGGQAPGRPAQLERLRGRLDPLFEESEVTPDVAATLAAVASWLCPATLGEEIQREMVQVRRYGADPALLNRLLLERAYPGGINSLAGLFDSGATSWVAGLLAKVGQATSSAILNDVPVFVASQLKTVTILALCALIPGVAGMIYRRAFRRWFLATFGGLFLINWMFATTGLGAIGADIRKELELSYDFYLWIEAVLLLLLLAYSLRRHLVGGIDARTRRNEVFVSIVLILAAAGWAYTMWDRSGPGRFALHMVGAAVLFAGALAVLRQSIAAGRYRATHGKNIVMCLDGTWNQPGTRDFGHLAETNVFKLFQMLKGSAIRNGYNASRCKEYLDGGQAVRQVGFYYHGVGNTVENSELGQLLGGAFGMGADAIVERAYLDLVRVYRPGDRIFIFGFSRGAAIARLLAGVIGRRDIPRSLWTLRLFGRHWGLWRSSRRVDESNPVKIEVLGCWDTVGAFGISKNILGIPFQKINLLKDLTVSLSVRRAYHMVALDETRDSFEPTLMDPDPTAPARVVEVWFSGNHSNIGGGYHTDKLSNVTLDFLLRHLSSGYAWAEGMQPGMDESWGLYLSAALKGVVSGSEATAAAIVDPDPCGKLRFATGPVYEHAPRKLPLHAVIHDSVFRRMGEALPVYAPQSVFDLNRELVRRQAAMAAEVEALAHTRTLGDEEAGRILEWFNTHLSLTKWSDFLDKARDGGIPMRERLRPAQELSNPATVPATRPVGAAGR